MLDPPDQDELPKTTGSMQNQVNILGAISLKAIQDWTIAHKTRAWFSKTHL